LFELSGTGGQIGVANPKQTLKEQIMNKTWACLLLAALALTNGCGKSQSTAASDDSDGSSKDDLIAKIDKHGDEIMSSSTKAEARAWMTT
jgi:hypothetical protein